MKYNNLESSRRSPQRTVPTDPHSSLRNRKILMYRFVKKNIVYLILTLCLTGCNSHPVRQPVESGDVAQERKAKVFTDSLEVTVDSIVTKDTIDSNTVSKIVAKKKDSVMVKKKKAKEEVNNRVENKKSKDKSSKGSGSKTYLKPEGVVLRLDSTVFKRPIKESDACIMHLVNYSDSVYHLGGYPHVEKYENNRWVVLKYPHRIIVEAVLVTLPKRTDKQSWFIPSQYHDDYKPGRYRVAETLESLNGDKVYAVFAEFDVIE